MNHRQAYKAVNLLYLRKHNKGTMILANGAIQFHGRTVSQERVIEQLADIRDFAQRVVKKIDALFKEISPNSVIHKE